MPAISASAPGKIILFGEHAVVYNRPAIAVPVFQVSARAIVRAAPNATSGTVRIQAPNTGLDNQLSALPKEHPLASAILGVLDMLDITHPPACTVRVTSSIPVAAGLGSGAAVSVATIRAFSAFLGRPLPDAKVSALAYEVEKIHHGTPSGIDNTVIVYRKPVYFLRGQPIETFQVSRAFTIVIGDTGISSPTGIAVADLRRLWEADPARYDSLFDRAGEIARAARQGIEAGKLETLGAMMDENQTLLRQMGVSSPELEALIKAARAAGASGAKLSGGGRGGNMIALVTAEGAPAVAHALHAAGAVRTIITEIRQR
jgi:mevalonate kinase